MPEGDKIELFFWWFQLGGAASGIVSLLWQVLTQFVGSYESRTIRLLLLEQRRDIQGFVRQLTALVGQVRQQGGR